MLQNKDHPVETLLMILINLQEILTIQIIEQKNEIQLIITKSDVNTTLLHTQTLVLSI